MNWDAIGAVAEALGALAVIISIIYLAAQVRQTRRQLEAQAEDNIASRSFEAFDPVYAGDNAKVFRKGLQAPETLDEDEAFLFGLLMDRQRGAFANIVRRRHSRLIAMDVSDHLLRNYTNMFLNTAGGQWWLQRSRGALSRLELEALGLERDG